MGSLSRIKFRGNNECIWIN